IQMPGLRAWLLSIVAVALLVVGSVWTHTRIALAAGLVLIGGGAAIALWGVPHLRDPLVLKSLKWSEYEQPQQPGIYAIAAGGVLVVAGAVILRGHMRTRR